jgi:hypothetical protein
MMKDLKRDWIVCSSRQNVSRDGSRKMSVQAGMEEEGQSWIGAEILKQHEIELEVEGERIMMMKMERKGWGICQPGLRDVGCTESV